MKVAFHTLGCKVNQYETEAMAGAFRRCGFQVVDERDFADVYVINTCTVTAIADKKSRQYIRRMKKVNPASVVAVTGCYAQINPEEVSLVEGVDIVAGSNEKNHLTEYVAAYLQEGIRQIHVKGYQELDAYDETEILTGVENRARAYIKIQEGCNKFCSYCVIPYARGKVRSRALPEIVREAEHLLETGCRELVLTGINTALYGMEDAAHSNPGFPGNAEERKASRQPYGVEMVIARLNRLSGDFRIRLSSLEPAVVDADYVERLLQYDKLCHHLHLSVQSGSDRVLRAMNRPYTSAEYMRIVKTLRDFDPCYGISTDVIVGFPGEKERDFEESCRLVERCGFCKTHIFKYSKRPFTEAAQMKEHVAPQVKNRRSDTLHRIGSKVAGTFFRQNCGRKERILFEEIHEEKQMVTGYADNYIRGYLRYRDETEAKGLLNRFAEVVMLEPFEDGMEVRLGNL